MPPFNYKKLEYVFLLASLIAQVQLQPIQPIEQNFLNYARPLGAYCGAFIANNYTGSCSWPIQTAWPYDMLQNKFAPEGPLYIIISKTDVMPPFTDPYSPYPSYLSQWNGVNLSDWLAMPKKFPSSFVLPLSSCGNEFGFVEQNGSTTLSVWFTQPSTTPDSSLGSPTYSFIRATPPQCRGNIYFDRTPICASTRAQRFESNCQPDPVNDCFSTQFAPTVKTPPYHSPSFPSGASYQGFPFAGEFYQIGAYTKLTECANGYGTNYDPGFPAENRPYDTTGTGIKTDLGYPSSMMGTIRVEIPDECNTAGVDQIMFQFSGLYNRMDYAPCVVNYDDTVDPNDPFAPWTSRIMFCPGLSCQADAPRSPKSTILSPQNVAEFSPFCRVSFPYNATLYGSGTARQKYLQATGGVIQPAAAPNIGYGTVPMAIEINNLPSNNYAVFLNMTGQTPLFWDLIPNYNPVPLFGTPLGLNNGQFVQFVQPDATTSIPNQYIILEQLYNNYTDPTPVMYPFDQPWLPACGCNTTSAMTDGTVICDSNYNFIGNQVLPVPNYNGGAAALTPVCQIVPGNGYSWFGGVYGNVLQNTPYGLSVQLLNSTSSNAGFNYQWYINDTANNNIEISDPLSASTYVSVLGSYTANIGVAVTSRDTRLTGICNVTLTVFRGCPVISLVATNTTTNFNTTIVLDASRTLSPEPTVQLTYKWSVFSSYPADAMSRLVMPYTNRPTIPLSATNVSIFDILLEVTGSRPDGTFCTATLTITINFFNGTNDFTDVGNPDGIQIPDSCFQNSLLNETFPDTGKDTPILSTPPGLFPGPVSALLNVQTTVIHYLTKWMATKTNENYKINGYHPTDVNNDLLLGIIIGAVGAISGLFLIFLLAPMEYCTNYPMLCTPLCCIRCRDKMLNSKCGRCCKKKRSRFLGNPEESKAIR